MKTFFKKLIFLALIVFIISAIIFGAINFGIVGIYKNDYQKGFVFQYRALQNADQNQNKIIVIGGSYMTFATDSMQLNKLTGMPVYTLGIHSSMGMDYILETAKEFANEGDIIVFSFLPYEPNEYGMDLIWLSLDSEPDMFWDFFSKHPIEVIKSFGPATAVKLHEFCFGNRDSEISSVYDARAFDPESGNMIFERSECIAEDKDLYCENSLDVNSITDDCANEVVELSKYCASNGVAFCMIYSPFFAGYYNMPTDRELDEYQAEVEDKLNEKFIVNIRDCEVQADCVYNLALHMNDKGQKYYTELIYKGLKQNGFLEKSKKSE